VAVRLPALLACAIAVFELLSMVPVGHDLGTLAPSPLPRPTSKVAGTSVMAAAESALQAGAGPAGGTPWSCSSALSVDAGVQCGLGSTPRANAAMGPTVPSWTSAVPPVPLARDLGAMVFDARDGYVLLFGGYSTKGDLKDTWKYVGGRWTELSPATSPPGRVGAAIAFDAKDNYVVLFGGASGSAALSDTWTWAAGAWTKLTPATHPTARSSAAATYDAKDGYVLLFGGFTGTSVVQSDTWKFVGGVWSKLTESVHPPGRYYASMDYDPAALEVVLFGGVNSSILGDTWNFSGGHWTNLTGTVGPGPTARYAAALAYSAKDGELVLFGGEILSGLVSDTWTFSGTNWTKISTYVHPSSRVAPMAADGQASGTVILFGGAGAGNVELNDTWTFHGLVWSHSLPPTPAPRALGMMTYDEADGYVLLFGGITNGSPSLTVGDTWKFVHGNWAELHPSVAPPPRQDGAITYDQADGYVLLFGGTTWNGSAVFNDTWSYVGGSWTRVLTSNSPPGRAYTTMTYDAADGYVLLFGGADTSGFLNDTWAYSGGVWWDPVTSTTAPAERYAESMAYDSEDGYVVLFGGDNPVSSVALTDTWTYSAGVWTNITATASTGPAYGSWGSLVDDTYDGYLVYFGGCDSGSYCSSVYVTNQTWSFVGGSWTELFPARNPGQLVFQSEAFDPPDNSVVVFGGVMGPSYTAATWTY
jgi:hypothetical protein